MPIFDLSRWFAGLGSASAEVGPAGALPRVDDAKIRRAVDTLPTTMFEFDANGLYTCAAGKYIGLFGIDEAQLIGRSVFDFPKFVPGKNMMVRRALAGEAVAFTGIWPFGRYMIRLEPRFDAGGCVEAVVGIGFELGKPEKSDAQFERLMEALRQSEARFRAMCENAPLGIYVTNPKLELGYVNPALCALLGRNPDELIGAQWHTLLHPDERERVQTIRPQRDTEFHDGVLRLLRADGSLVWTSLRMAAMRDDGEVLGYVGAVADITGEYAARLAADRAQRDLRRMIESSPEGIAVVRDGRWLSVNRALREALGQPSSDALIGRMVVEIVHSDDRPRVRQLVSGAQPGPSESGPDELRFQRADGDYALMELTSAELSEFDGARALLLTARDITQRKRLQAQLLVSERLLSVGTLAAGVAHEINNPLAALLSNLEWATAQLTRVDRALAQPEIDPLVIAALRAEFQRLDGVVSEAREAAGRVRAIVRDLKLFSRAEEELIGPVDLRRVLDSAARMAWNELRHRARFTRQYGELPPVNGSEARLGQVFLNLIINAAHAIPEDNADAHEISLSAYPEGSDHVVVEVSDTGSGIPASVLGRIFDPFFTTKPPGVGTGLGLTICHRIVTGLGGRIEVESRPGKGSTFRVTLATTEHEARITPPPPPPMPAAQLRGRVLVIDDDASMGSAIKLVLSEEHDVDVFVSARQALDRLRGGQAYDAIVCDVMMPEMSGIDFHAELAASQPEAATEIIFLTGGAFTLRAREFLDRVPNPRLDKPFDSESLRALVNRRISRPS